MSSRKRGVALIWVLILSTILLIISGTMASYIVKESQFSVRTDQSSQAYSYAKSGIEWALAEIENNNAETRTKEFNLNEDDLNEISVVILDPVSSPQNCPPQNTFCIESTGQDGAVTRKIDYKTTGSPLNRVNPSNLTSTDIGANTKSFTLQFDFWSSGVANGTGFGVQNLSSNSNSTRYIYLRMSSGELHLYAKTADSAEPIVVPVVSTTGLTSATLKTSPYAYRATLKYIELTAASVKIEERNVVTGEYECVGYAVVPLVDINMKDMRYLRIMTAGTYRTGDMLADGSFLEVANATNGSRIYVDNIYTSTAPIAGGTEPTPPLPRFTVKATVLTGGGSVSIVPNDNPQLGEDVTLIATPSANYAFSHWGGNCSGTNSSYVISKIETNYDCTANFYPTQPVYWFTSTLEYFFSTTSTEGTPFYTNQGVAWYGPSSSFSGSAAVERYRYASTGRHFFQLSTAREISASASWIYEGTSWYAFSANATNRRNVCRYRHPTIGDAHIWSLTCDPAGLAGYIYEGPTFSIPR